MAIDWKTIISEFDGKPTLLQAIGKLRKAVEDETITIQQAQAEIAKLESQQKTDEALITTAQTTANNAQSAAQAADTKAQAADTKAQAADTKAQNALDLATKKLYMHSIKFDGYFGTVTSDGLIKITVYSYSQEPFTFSTLGSYLNRVEVPAYGKIYNTDMTDFIGIPTSMYVGTTYTLYWFKFSDSSIQITNATSGDITDTVTEV